MSFVGILVGLGVLIWLSYRGWSVLLLAPAAALIAAAFAGEPLLAHWTVTFMRAAAGFVAQYFPLFLLGAIFGKLMDDSGAVLSIARGMTHWLGPQRALLAIVLAGALLTYGGVSLFVAFFVLAPMGHALFHTANLPARLMPAAIALGTSTFTMSALPGSPSIQNAIPMPFFGTTAFAAPGLGVIASVVMVGFGLWWLSRSEARARRRSEGYASPTRALADAQDPLLRERGSTATHFDPMEMAHGARPTADTGNAEEAQPGTLGSLIPLMVVIGVNLVAGLWLLPRADLSYLETARFGGLRAGQVAGLWAVLLGLAAGLVALLLLHRGRLANLRGSVDAGANAAVLPVMSVASLVGFGAVVADMPAFSTVRDWVMNIEAGPLVSLALSTNLLAALTGSASGGLTIALETLGPAYMEIAQQIHLDPSLLHRLAVIGAGTLDSLPHNGAVVSLLAVCGCTHRESYRDIVMVSIVGALLALIIVLVLGTWFGSF
ncbi:GntP family permease [Comamonas guangdongensis]|uniref:GntP family permease n=1 Tax=Comamonas guangdongensis TaxID=510515 RepID=A0ABV3ZY15_9BURK